MSTDYSAFLLVGFRLEEESLVDFKRRWPERWHNEPRFDTKTGIRLADARVVDEVQRTRLEFDGNSGLDFIEFCELAANKIGCEMEVCGSDCEIAYFYLPISTEGGGSIHPHFDVGGSARFEDVVALGPRLEQMRIALDHLKIPAVGPLVGLCWSAG